MELTKEQKDQVLHDLRQLYIDREDRSALNFSTPYECLVAVILSTQCTDERVNIVTDELFKEYNTPERMVELSFEELKEKIKSCGLTNNKAKNILASSQMLIDNFNSEVPKTKEEIMTLPGVGSKTANVVLSNVYGVPGIGVDTHVFRVANRIGLADGKTPNKVEKDLTELIPEEFWTKAHHWLLWHGRKVCSSRKPKCHECPVRNNCKFYLESQEAEKTNEATE